jgi:hypothetical protein
MDPCAAVEAYRESYRRVVETLVAASSLEGEKEKRARARDVLCCVGRVALRWACCASVLTASHVCCVHCRPSADVQQRTRDLLRLAKSIELYLAPYTSVSSTVAHLPRPPSDDDESQQLQAVRAFALHVRAAVTLFTCLLTRAHTHTCTHARARSLSHLAQQIDLLEHELAAKQQLLDHTFSLVAQVTEDLRSVEDGNRSVLNRFFEPVGTSAAAAAAGPAAPASR